MEEEIFEIKTAHNTYYYDTRYKMVWGGRLIQPESYMAVQIDERAIFFNEKGEKLLTTSPLAGYRKL